MGRVGEVRLLSLLELLFTRLSECHTVRLSYSYPDSQTNLQTVRLSDCQTIFSLCPIVSEISHLAARLRLVVQGSNTSMINLHR